MNITRGWLNARGEVLIAASGSSRHAGLAAEIILEDLCGLAVDVEYSSEYSSRPAVNPRRPSVLVISQSGETSDTLAALRFARDGGQQTLAIANVVGSTMLREAGGAMPLGAGPELAIPATKSFTCQLTALYLLALYEGSRLGAFEPAQFKARVAELRALPEAIGRQLEGWRERMTALAKKYNDADSFLYLGRGVHYAIAREGALKMKESSYVQAEGYPTGELKHGPNALVGEHVPLVALATVDRNVDDSVLRYEKTLQLLADMKTQGARVIAIANSGDREVPSAGYGLRVCGAGKRTSVADSRGYSAAAFQLCDGAGAWRGRGPAEKSFKSCDRSVEAGTRDYQYVKHPPMAMQLFGCAKLFLQTLDVKSSLQKTCMEGIVAKSSND